MEILLFFLSIGLLIFYSVVIKKDFANPGFIYLGVWLLAILSSIFVTGKELDISLLTVFVIFVGNFLFLVGVYFSEFTIKTSSTIQKDISYIPTWLGVVFILVLPLLLFYVFRDLMNVSAIVEPSTSFNKVIEGARYATTRSLGRISYISANILRFFYSLGIVSFYYFCNAYFVTFQSKT
ncbi:TPA: hypothetical protein ACHVI3_002201, partial [Streptococcus suis]